METKNPKDAQLIEAASDNNLAEIKRLIAEGADIKATDENDDNALMVAAINGHFAAVEILLEAGAEDNYDQDALMHAVSEGHAKIVEILIVADADVNQMYYRGRDNFTALMAATKNRDDDVVKMLLSYGANINEKGDCEKTALMIAAGQRDTKIIKRLLNNGASINAIDICGCTALMWAAIEGRTETVKVLLDAGADVNMKDDDGETALDLAKPEVAALIKQHISKS